uniref:NmrA-like domain-containing protein n=1 Tax=Mycena chlorophos TaxID=658473 RepID=A0ABQ0LT67_MYCCL|nr:predicted protein [Mycena chlorophos]
MDNLEPLFALYFLTSAYTIPSRRPGTPWSTWITHSRRWRRSSELLPFKFLRSVSYSPPTFAEKTLERQQSNLRVPLRYVQTGTDARGRAANDASNIQAQKKLQSKMKNILFIGGTGYVGGVILSRFLDRHLDARITALVRSLDKVQKLAELSKSGTLKNEFVVVQGTHHDGPLVEKLASEADEVFSLADCDDLGAMELILAGMKKRFEATGVKPILFHMSGTGALGDKAKGMFASTQVYNDLDIASIESLSATQNHRNVDLAVVAADAAGYVSTYIVLPGVFFGVPRGRLADLGVQNMQNFAWVIMYRASIGARGAAGIMGEGKNLMSFVEVNETVDMIDLLYDAIQAGTAPHGREGYYFIVTDIIALERLTEIVETRAGPRRPWTQAELDLYMPGATSLQDFFGDNGVAVSGRGKQMGWKPVLGKEELLQSIRDEVAQWKEGN